MRSTLTLDRRVQTVFLLFGVLFGATRCTSPASPQQGGTACHQRLSVLCPNGKCQTYAEAVAELRQRVSSQTAFCATADVGRCGALRYVATDNLLSGTTRFFDQSDRLVAARIFNDVPPCTETVLGADVPRCEMIVEQSFCPTGR
jgi:hypothetical protein